MITLGDSLLIKESSGLFRLEECMKKFKAVSLVIFLSMIVGCSTPPVETRIITEPTTEEDIVEVTTEKLTTENTTEVKTEKTTEQKTEATTEIITEATTEAITEVINEPVIYEPEIVEEDIEEKASETDAEEVIVVDDETDQDSYIYVGTYELTAYAATGNPCADGVYPTPYVTAASNDPNLWHKWIHIEGYGDYYVHDTGGMSSNVIDLFLGDYDSCVAFGRQIGEVYIIP
jgi:3D (Asp-Asp-Asp) domain-containing protein